MTRKRTNESLGQMLTEACPYCEGNGTIKSKLTIGYELLRRLRREGPSFKENTIVVTAHPEIAELLVTTDHAYIEELEQRLIRAEQELARQQKVAEETAAEICRLRKQPNCPPPAPDAVSSVSVDVTQ